MTAAEDSERQHLIELLGAAPTGEVSSGGLTGLYFVDQWEDDAAVTFVTLGLGARQPLADAEPYELGLLLAGVYDVVDLERITRAVLAIAQRLAEERKVVAPEKVVAIGELAADFPGRALALVTDFMFRGPDYLPMARAPDAATARLLFLRPIFADELRWIRTMSQAQVGEAFAKAGVRLENSQRDSLLVRVGPHILPSENEALPMAPTSTADIKRLYASLATWLKEHSQSTYADLQDPVSAADLNALETALGQKLPAELRTALEIHDGEPYLDSYMVMSASRIQDRYQSELEHADKASPIPSDGTCRAVVWSKGWIPFAEDGAQNFLCIDLDPGKKGTAGQVIRWERAQQGAAAAQWKSFGEWLEAMVNACLGGKVDVDDEGFVTLK